jgi:hypothetical protein
LAKYRVAVEEETTAVIPVNFIANGEQGFNNQGLNFAREIQ